MPQQGGGRTRLTASAGAIAVALAMIALAACSPRTNTHGNLVDPEALGQIKAGEQTKEQVQNLLGSPSSVGAFDQNTWYYISKQTQQVAFLEPTVLEQKVVEIDFDGKGIVKSVHRFGEDDGKEIAIVSRTTPTRGKSLGVLDELLNTLLKQVASGNVDATKRDPFVRR